jgi:spore coat polysaccharide biosynthesis predicted glycosyltransferase SpsG
MTRDPILIRVDGTARTGHERLARCLILAAALQRRRRTAYFLSQLDPGFLALNVKRGGNDWIEAEHDAGSEDDAADVVREIQRLQPAGVIVDDENVTEDYLAEIAGTGALVVSIDHQANIRLPSQLIINPLLGPGKEAYEFAPGAQLLLGQRYALVRPEIRRQRPIRSQEPPPMCLPEQQGGAGQFRALLALGEDDPNNQLLDLAKLLLNVPRIGKVDVIVRRWHPQLEEIRAVAEANAERLEVAIEPAEVAQRIVRCHFALTSGSGWSLELACVGVPQLLLVQNEAHWPTAQRLEEEGCATCLGWHESVSAQTIRLAIANLLTDPLERQAMARCGRKLIDGRGTDRFVTGLEVMLHPSRLAGSFREAA